MLLIITIQPDGKILLNSDDNDATGKAFALLSDRMRTAAEEWVSERSQLGALAILAGSIDGRDVTALGHIGFTGFALAVVFEDVPTSVNFRGGRDLLPNSPGEVDG